MGEAASDAAYAGEARDMSALSTDIRTRLGPAPDLAEWPLVSIVVVNRDGAAHLRRLLAGLVERTDYPRIELILVDNGSTDESLGLARAFPAPFAISIVANPHNETFSDANNQGAALASGELLLLLNNDAEPFEPGWLRELVACMRSTGAGVVGTTLLYRDEALGYRHGYAVQHRGMRFRDEAGLLRADLHGYRADPLGDGFGEDAPAPVVTGACMLVERALYERLGGLPRGYRYGVEDADFGLSVRAAGLPIVNSGRAFVLHRPGSTRRIGDLEQRRARQLRNRRLFWGRWGPRIRREYELDRLAGSPLWGEPGLDDPDRGPSREEALALGFCVQAGDEHAAAPARALADALERRGHPCLTLDGDAVDDPRALNYDVAVHVRGASRYVLDSGQLNVLWVVGDPPSQPIESARYDVVAAGGPEQLLEAVTAEAAGRGLPARIAPAASPPRSRPRPPSELLVLCYHGISDSWPAETTVTPGDFERHMLDLVDAGYVGATFSEALTAPREGRTVVVTFDDAHASVLEHAVPLMERLGLPGTVFVATDYPDSGRPMGWDGYHVWLGTEHEHELRCMGWDDLRALAGRGWEIGSHTCSHPRLTRLADDRELADELSRSRADCERRLGAPVRSLAYPYSHYDERVARAARDCGYTFAAAVANRPLAALPFQWPRLALRRGDRTPPMAAPGQARDRGSAP